MPKFEFEVVKTHFIKHVVEADDLDHAMSIASEFSTEMDSTLDNFFDSSWRANPAGDYQDITYTPTQEYLK